MAVADRSDGQAHRDLLAILDGDRQGWALAGSVRENGRIVDFELIYINEAGARLLHRNRADLVGGRYRQLWPETVHARLKRIHVRASDQRDLVVVTGQRIEIRKRVVVEQRLRLC